MVAIVRFHVAFLFFVLPAPLVAVLTLPLRCCWHFWPAGGTNCRRTHEPGGIAIAIGVMIDATIR